MYLASMLLNVVGCTRSKYSLQRWKSHYSQFCDNNDNYNKRCIIIWKNISTEFNHNSCFVSILIIYQLNNPQKRQLLHWWTIQRLNFTADKWNRLEHNKRVIWSTLLLGRFGSVYFQFVSLFNFIQNAFLSTHCEKRRVIIEALKNAKPFLKGLIFKKALSFI